MKIHTIKFDEADRARFDEVKEGRKKIETRAPNEKYDSIKEGDEIMFKCGDAQPFTKKVTKIYRWPTVETMFSEVSLEEVMPGLLTIEEAKNRYATYRGYTERIEKGGILGFRLV